MKSIEQDDDGRWYCQICAKEQRGLGNQMRWPNDPDVTIIVCEECYLKYNA